MRRRRASARPIISPRRPRRRRTQPTSQLQPLRRAALRAAERYGASVFRQQRRSLPHRQRCGHARRRRQAGTIRATYYPGSPARRRGRGLSTTMPRRRRRRMGIMAIAAVFALGGDRHRRRVRLSRAVWLIRVRAAAAGDQGRYRAEQDRAGGAAQGRSTKLIYRPRRRHAQTRNWCRAKNSRSTSRTDPGSGAGDARRRKTCSLRRR